MSLKKKKENSKNSCNLNAEVTCSHMKYLKLDDKDPICQGFSFTIPLEKPHPNYFLIMQMVGGCLQSPGYKSYPGGQDICLGGKRNKLKFGVRLNKLNFHLRRFPGASGNNLLCFFINQKARFTLKKKKTLSLIVLAAD